MAKGSVISSSAYNTIQSTVSNVMGVGSGTSGYGQRVLSSPVVAGSVITAAQWANLASDLGKAYTHQTNSAVINGAASTYPNPPYLQTITSGSATISEDVRVQYTNFATYINTNRTTAAAAQLTSGIAITSTSRIASWGGTSSGIQAVSHTVTVTFGGYTPTGGTAVSAADHARVFFNAGGSINISATLAGYSGSKGTDWYNMLAGFGTLNFRQSSAAISGTVNSGGSVVSLGFTNLTVGAAAQTILTQTSSVTRYAINRYIVTAARPTANTLSFVIYFQDNSVVGNPAGTTIDEEVTGTLTSIVQCTRPSGANVDVPAPTGTATAL